MAEPKGLSETISPYAPNFWNHIEDGIKPLVKAFTDKNYLPYSCCEGHSFFGRRFVSLAFPSKKDARILADRLRKIDDGILRFKMKSPLDYYHNGQRDIQKEVGWLNSIYLRGYEEYYFLEISVGENSRPTVGNIPLIIKKILLRNCITNRLVHYVENVLPINEN